MQEHFIDMVFLSLHGQLLPNYMIPGVENIFAQGSVGIALYEQARAAYDRLCNRLGVHDEDADLDVIVRSLEAIGKEIGYRMYKYGAQFGMRK
jgi:hypothetical protein